MEFDTLFLGGDHNRKQYGEIFLEIYQIFFVNFFVSKLGVYLQFASQMLFLAESHPLQWGVN